MIDGLRTVSYIAPDLAAGKAFYTAVVGHAPYFDEPFYVGFNVGGFELGLMPDGAPGAGGSVAYWGTHHIEQEVERIVKLGATIVEAAHDVGGGISVATLADPFGNLFGLIHNPHFDRTAVR
jgi:predicted enzyme related to lactoylglutathione lyase